MYLSSDFLCVLKIGQYFGVGWQLSQVLFFFLKQNWRHFSITWQAGYSSQSCNKIQLPASSQHSAACTLSCSCTAPLIFLERSLCTRMIGCSSYAGVVIPCQSMPVLWKNCGSTGRINRQEGYVQGYTENKLLFDAIDRLQHLSSFILPRGSTLRNSVFFSFRWKNIFLSSNMSLGQRVWLRLVSLLDYVTFLL